MLKIFDHTSTQLSALLNRQTTSFITKTNQPQNFLIQSQKDEKDVGTHMIRISPRFAKAGITDATVEKP
jgi:hypothetical protein